MQELSRPPERGYQDQRSILQREVDAYRANGYVTRVEAAKILNCSQATVSVWLGKPNLVLQRNGQKVFMYLRSQVEKVKNEQA